MAKSMLPFLDPFKLILDPDYQSKNLIEDGLNSISVLSSISQDCTNLVACFRDKGEPSEQMLIQVTYSASVLNGLVVGISDILAGVETQTN